MRRRSHHYQLLLRCLLLIPILLISLRIGGEATPLVKAASSTASRVYLRTGTRVYHHWALSWFFEEEIFGCNIYTVTHDQPGHEDVLGYCGSDIYQQWHTGPLCVETPANIGQCRGLTLIDYGEIEERLKTTIRLPFPTVEIGIVNCQPWQNCRESARIQFIGSEPLKNHRIESVHVEYANHTGLVCWRTDRCTVEMPQTGHEGTNVIVYVTSSYGDESEDLIFRLRKLPISEETFLFELLNTSYDNIAPPESVAW
jgi:hypothetical protein